MGARSSRSCVHTYRSAVSAIAVCHPCERCASRASFGFEGPKVLVRPSNIQRAHLNEFRGLSSIVLPALSKNRYLLRGNCTNACVRRRPIAFVLHDEAKRGTVDTAPHHRKGSPPRETLYTAATAMLKGCCCYNDGICSLAACSSGGRTDSRQMPPRR